MVVYVLDRRLYMYRYDSVMVMYASDRLLYMYKYESVMDSPGQLSMTNERLILIPLLALKLNL